MELAISVVIFGLIFNNLVAKKLIKMSYFGSKFNRTYCCTGQDGQLEIGGCYFVTAGRMWISVMKVTFVVFSTRRKC